MITPVNWLESMQQTFEFFKVDPATWMDKEQINSITKCSITRDLESSTLGSATLTGTEPLEECYIRVYIKVIQNGMNYRYPLGTYLVQTPSVDFDGKKQTVTMDAYTPLIELKNSVPPIGYSILKQEKVMPVAYTLTQENVRAPVVKPHDDKDTTLEQNFVSDISETWITFLSDLIAKAKFSFSLDDMGRILYSADQDMAALRPVWTFDDGNSSILLPDISDSRDLYNIPNVVQVVYSSGVGYMSSTVENNDANSPVSIQNRGRRVVYRETSPSFPGLPSQEAIDEYANELLKSVSTLQHRITFEHGYCPVREGDCVILDYKRAGLRNIKAKVISQKINCETGCTIQATAVYTTKLWR